MDRGDAVRRGARLEGWDVEKGVPRDAPGRHGRRIEVRGKGLLAAIEFDSDIASTVLTYANAVGVLLNAVKPTALRFMPPLTITAEEIDEGIGRLEQALKEI